MLFTILCHSARVSQKPYILHEVAHCRLVSNRVERSLFNVQADNAVIDGIFW